VPFKLLLFDARSLGPAIQVAAKPHPTSGGQAVIPVIATTALQI